MKNFTGLLLSLASPHSDPHFLEAFTFNSFSYIFLVLNSVFNNICVLLFLGFPIWDIIYWHDFLPWKMEFFTSFPVASPSFPHPVHIGLNMYSTLRYYDHIKVSHGKARYYFIIKFTVLYNFLLPPNCLILFLLSFLWFCC